MSDPDLQNVASVEGVQWTVRSGRPPLSFPIQDQVVTEEPLQIRLAHAGRAVAVSVTMRTPTEDENLAAGFLFTEGIVTDRHAIERIESHRTQGDHIVDVHTRHAIEVDPALRRPFLTNSSCGVCGRALVQGIYAERGGPVQSDLVVSADRLVEMPKTLRAAQRIFARTGGLHAAGLFDVAGTLLRVAEDIGRHNAVDKVIGARFLAGETPDPHVVLQVSGRVSFEIVQKAGAAGIPVVSAVSAPSSLAVSLADRLGITLAAFVRDDRMNVYSHPERLVEATALPTQ